MKFRRLILSLSFVAALALVPSGCAPNMPPNLPAQTQAIYYADDVMAKLIQIQQTAIDANKAIVNGKPALTNTQTRKVLNLLDQVADVLERVPEGWRPIVKQIWVEAKPKFAAANFKPLVVLLDALLGVL